MKIIYGPGHYHRYRNLAAGTIGSAKILPYQLGYDIQRRDRPNDTYAGVLIAAKKHLQLKGVEYRTNIEFISASITAGKKSPDS